MDRARAERFLPELDHDAGQGHGYEFNLVLIGALVSLMFTGPGALSFDSHRASAAETEALGRARMRAGAA